MQPHEARAISPVDGLTHLFSREIEAALQVADARRAAASALEVLGQLHFGAGIEESNRLSGVDTPQRHQRQVLDHEDGIRLAAVFDVVQ